jgi:hypothetical protein
VLLKIKDGSGHFLLESDPPVPHMANVTYNAGLPRDVTVCSACEKIIFYLPFVLRFGGSITLIYFL